MLVLDEDQELLAANARQVVDAEAPVSRFRALRDAGGGLDRTLWEALVAQGWAALTVSEADGGMGLGLAEAAIVMEALGRNLAAVPMAGSVAVAPILPSLALEGAVVALAWREHPRQRDPRAIAAKVVSGRLTGRKRAVEDGSEAGILLVSAVSDGGIGLYKVDASDAVRTRLTRVDHRDAADLAFKGVPAERVGGEEALRVVLDRARVCAAAEALGGAQALFERCRAWLHERVQFGVPIGSFQVLQHRMVDRLVDLELTRSAVMQAAREPEPRWVELAAIKSAEAYLAMAKEAVQLHGGIGMTDECDVGLFLKRAMVLAA